MRAGVHGCKWHKLTLQIPLPPQKIILTVTENKVQLHVMVAKLQTEKNTENMTIEI